MNLRTKAPLRPFFRKAISATIIALVASTATVPQAARAATVADSMNVCQLAVTSGGVTVDSTSVPVYLSGIYCVAAFKTIGTYSLTVPATTNAIDYVVVAGGGGGASGGGGAGGLLQGSNYSVTPGAAVTVTVGAGGSGGNGGSAQSGVAGSAGSNSVLGSLTAVGGGGGNSGGRTVTTGGSGGGSSYDCTGSGGSCGLAGNGTVGQGNNGGYSTYNSYGAGGGGGGAGGAGYNTTRNYIGGNGGIGATSTLINDFATATGIGQLSSGNYYLAGGGGGGINDNTNQYVGLNASSSLIYGGNSGAAAAGTVYTNGGGQGGLGGGGRGSSFGRSGGTAGQYANAASGTANTGGGGGGTDPEDINAGAGGSGVVMIRWVADTNLSSVTFNANLGASETSTQRVVNGRSTQLSANTFARSGYIFAGWDTLANGTGTHYDNSSNITTSTNITLYAQWNTGVNKSVTFDGNTSTSGSMTSQSAGSATALNSNQYTKSSYTFTGWNTAANGSGYAYSDGAVYSFSTDVTLYAQWTLTRTAYTVTFYANAVDASGTTASQTADTATALTLNGFSRPGYSFLGWNSTYNAGTASYIDGQKYAFSSNLNLYAQWVAQASNSVTFDSNTATSGSTASQTASASTTLNSNGFTKDGYTFIGWNTAANGSGTSYSSGYTYSFASGLTLYAQWSRNLTISYDGNLSESGTVPSSQSYYFGGPTLTVAGNSGNLRRAGYTLVGWNTQAGGGGRSYALSGSRSTFTDDTVLYAQWSGSTYYVLYSGNDNTGGSSPSTQSFTTGQSLTLRENTGALTRTGYTFDKWNTKADGTGSDYSESATGQTFSSDTVLFAKWRGNTYSISYDGNSGSVDTSTTTFTYGSGGITLRTPTKTGYSFQGWYDTTTAGTRISDGGVNYNQAQSRTLYAQWAINHYTIDYDGRGGSVDTSTVSFTYGDAPITLRTPTRTSYKFEGWYTAPTGGTKIGSAAEAHTPTATRTLYAQWTQWSLVGLSSPTRIGAITTVSGVGNTYSASTGSTSVTLNYVADALPAGTVIDAYLSGSTAHAASLITSESNLLLSMVIAWKAPDSTVPATVTGKPLTMTINNPAIKAGAKIYSVIGDSATVVATATADGSVTVEMTEDPEIVIANPPVASSGGGGSSNSDNSSEIAARDAAAKKAAADKAAADQAAQDAIAAEILKKALADLAAAQATKAAQPTAPVEVAAVAVHIKSMFKRLTQAIRTRITTPTEQALLLSYTKKLQKFSKVKQSAKVQMPKSAPLKSRVISKKQSVCTVNSKQVLTFKKHSTCPVSVLATTSSGNTFRTTVLIKRK